MRTFCAERSRADWDWELWMFLLETGVDEKGILMETSLIRKKTTQQPKTPLPLDAGHHLYSSGWITALSCQGGTSSSPSDLACLRFLVGIFLLAPQLLFPYLGQDSASCPRASMGIPTLAIFCPLRAAQPFLPHPHPALCPGWSCLRSHFSVRCRVWAHPTQWEHPQLARERKTLRATIN